MNAWMQENGQSLIQLLLIILLIVGFLLIIRIISLLGKFIRMGDKLNNSLDIVNDYLDDMKMPVRAIVNVSMSVEALRAASESSMRGFFDSITATCNKIIDQLKKIIEAITKKKEEQVIEVRAAEELPEEAAEKPEENKEG